MTAMMPMTPPANSSPGLRGSLPPWHANRSGPAPSLSDTDERLSIAPKFSRFHQVSEDALAAASLEIEEAGRLGERQLESGHLAEFSPNPAMHGVFLVIHRSSFSAGLLTIVH
jgi:hypothetical protein